MLINVIPVSVDLRKLSDVVKNYFVKKTKFDEMLKRVNDIKTTHTSDLVKKSGI